MRIQGVLLISTIILICGILHAAQDNKYLLLETKIQTLAEEIQNLKENSAPKLGFAKTSFHGYGEVHYNQKSGIDMIDYHRFALGWTHNFNDNITLEGEVDFEHAGTELELEFANISFMLTDDFFLRAGSILLPIGPLNEFHEPTRFLSVERPYLYNIIIPTSWNEAGFGILGKTDFGLKYQLYIVSGLDSSKFTGSSGIRSGRTKLASAVGETWGLVSRLEYNPIPNFVFGLSAYSAGAAQGNAALGQAGVSIYESDLFFKLAGFQLNVGGALLLLSDAGRISVVKGEAVAERMSGWLTELSYNIGSHCLPENQSFHFFIRKESINTHEAVSTGYSANPAYHREVFDWGVAYAPISEVIIKSDWETGTTRAGTVWQQWNVGMGYEW